MAWEDLDTALLGNQLGFWHKLKTHRAGKEEIICNTNGGIGWAKNGHKEVIEKWRNDFATLLNANSSIPHSCTTESEKVCEAEMPPQLSEPISPGVKEAGK